MRLLFAALSFFVVLLGVDAAPVATPTPAPAAPNIHINSCQVVTGQPIIGSAYQVGLGVRFTNNDSVVYKEIVWRAKFGKGYVDFKDDGEFSPQVKIDNFPYVDIGKAHVNILGALLAPRGADIPVESQVRFPEYVSLNDPENCQIIKTVTQDDDATWVAPGVSPEPHYVLPAPAPSAEATLAPGEEDTPKGTVDVAHCHVLFPYRRNTAQVDVGYRSISPGKKADKITFRVNYGDGNFDAVDSGEFADGDYVRHHLKVDLPDTLAGRSYFAFDDPSNCVAVDVHYLDGSEWKNPNAPEPMPVPTKIPDALDGGLGEWVVRWQRTDRFDAPSPSPSPTPDVNTSAKPSPSPK